jgi:dihydroorotase
MTLLLEGGRLVCPATGADRVGDLAIRDGHIVDPASLGDDAQRLDCSGQVVAPALVDLDARFCDPGMTWRETLATGARAAAAGGFTTVLANPEVEPVTDDAALVRDLLARGEREACIEIRVAGALTRGLKGADLSEVGLMVQAGAAALSNADALVPDTRVLRHALQYLRRFDRPVLLRAGEAGLEAGAVMHEGMGSALAGLRGLPEAAEEIGITRLIALVRDTGARVHVTGVTTARGAELVRRAQADGASLTASTTPLHLVLTDRAVVDTDYDTNTRVWPPLRSELDRQALVQAVLDGVLTVASAHTPWTRVEKELEFALASSGAVGLETAFGCVLHALGSVPATLQALSCGPARVLGLERSLSVGSQAEVLVFSPDATWTVDPSAMHSLGRNTPLGGRSLPGVVHAVIHRGALL